MDFSSIDTRSSEKLYLQIRRLIVRAIQEETLSPGEQIPSIAGIADAAGVSRMTVRHALDALINEGWIYTVPGKGSFVAAKAGVVLDLNRLVGWSKELNMQGVASATRLVSLERVKSIKRVAQALRVPDETALFKIVRIQMAEGVPLGVDTTYMVADRLPGFEAALYAEPASISHVLLHQYGVKLLRGTQFVEAAGSDQALSQLLNVALGTPILMVERTTFTVGDIPVQFIQSIHLSGLVRFKVELTSITAQPQ